jgi:hypothetical protein
MERELIETLLRLFGRDLGTLASEIGQYPSDEALWSTAGTIKNPAGNLCLHLCGNLQHYIGHGIGHSTYVRNRDKEFSEKGLSRALLLQEIQNTKTAVLGTLEAMEPALLSTPYPLPVFDYPMSHLHFLTHLLAHLGYHLGQINYHRRLLTQGE